MKSIRSWGRVAGVTATGLILLAGGCAAPKSTRAVAYGRLDFTLNGDVGEWPADAAVAADEHYLYVRFTVQDERFTLQSSQESVAIMLDVDGSSATGLVGRSDPLSGQGTDLEIVFSPAGAGGERTSGVSLRAVSANGTRTALSGADFDLIVAPTYASTWYELRLSRTPASVAPIPAEGLLGGGTLRGVAGIMGSDGELDAWADPFAIGGLGPPAMSPAWADADVPAKPVGAVRVVTYNVQRDGPLKNAAPFGRVLTALDPDIVLVQEWESGSAGDVAGWFHVNVPSAAGWQAVKAEGDLSGGGGVAVVSRHTVEPLVTGVTRGAEARPVRFVGAIVRTPTGEVLAGSAHLKCCGSMGSAEDEARLGEADAINAAFSDAARAKPRARRVIGGDLNLVGSRPPLDRLRLGLDADGTDLAVAESRVLGDAQHATWADAGTAFTPGRLDWLTFSDSNARVLNSFVLDTRRLSDEALARLGLDRSDAAASDHMPVVLDIAW